MIMMSKGGHNAAVPNNLTGTEPTRDLDGSQ
jgi:hypothetical protein